jgi:hypothetical protein
MSQIAIIAAVAAVASSSTGVQQAGAMRLARRDGKNEPKLPELRRFEKWGEKLKKARGETETEKRTFDHAYPKKDIQMLPWFNPMRFLAQDSYTAKMARWAELEKLWGSDLEALQQKHKKTSELNDLEDAERNLRESNDFKLAQTGLLMQRVLAKQHLYESHAGLKTFEEGDAARAARKLQRERKKREEAEKQHYFIAMAGIVASPFVLLAALLGARKAFGQKKDDDDDSDDEDGLRGAIAIKKSGSGSGSDIGCSTAEESDEDDESDDESTGADAESTKLMREP